LGHTSYLYGPNKVGYSIRRDWEVKLRERDPENMPTMEELLRRTMLFRRTMQHPRDAGREGNQNNLSSRRKKSQEMRKG